MKSRSVAVSLLVISTTVTHFAWSESFDSETAIYRSTESQDFRRVDGAEWSKLGGPGMEVIDLDAAEDRQLYRGLGGSFTESACYNLMKLPESKRRQAFEMLFGEKGLRLSIGRINCGASNYSLKLYTYDDVPGDVALENFSVVRDRQWVLPAIREALELNPDIYFFSSPWSAPGWMKVNGTVCGGRLKPDMFGTYADYIVRFLKAYAAEGVRISAHTLQNEVLTEQKRQSPTMLLPPEDEARLIAELAPRLRSEGLDIRLWIHDHNYVDTNSVRKTLSIPGVREAIGGIAWHSYKGAPEAIVSIGRDFPELEQIHTEKGPHIDRLKRDMLYWGDLVLRGFNSGQTGFVSWNFALDENGQPNVSQGFPCGGLLAIDSESGEIVPSEQYRLFRCIGPFVRPGARVLSASVGEKDGVVVSSFRNPDGSFVIVMNNSFKGGRQIAVRYKGFILPVQLLRRSVTTVVIRRRNPSPWVSAEERAACAKRSCGMDAQPGTPESDAVRFYANSNHAEWVEFNYDESKAGALGVDYTLEDPLVFADGRKVVTAADWGDRRRELLDLFEREVYGRLPPKPDTMIFDVIEEKMSGDRFATTRVYRQYFREDRTGPVIDWFVALPRHAKGLSPVFLHLNYAGLEKIAAKKTNHFDLPWDMLVANGYAFMSAKYTQITSDGKNGGDELFNGVCELFGPRDPKRSDNPGALIIWAWGLMRGLDLAESIREIDASRNVVIGSSRLGKAALLAAAYDDRFRVCIPNQTGAVGVQLMKRDYGETLKGQHLSLPHWYCQAVWKYEDNPRSQPFDQHLLLACVAPRALLLECYHKKWFDPKGEWLAAKAASPVWEFLTGKGLGADVWPEPYSEALVRPPFGYVRRTECHGLSPYDWKWAVDFANNVLR